MSRVPGWLGRLGAGLTEMSERLDERRAAVERESDDLQPMRQSAKEPESAADAPPPALETLCDE
ncbi:AI-2E family transporter, partial [Streptomyces muensis]|nr:AI-2E family transporter [Streptomyces muensis]